MTSDLKGQLYIASRELGHAKSVAVLTGAGMSKESGIPTFRDAQTGLWSKYDPETLATPEGFSKDPDLVWQWYDYRRRLVLQAKPNAGHEALQQLEYMRRGDAEVSIITQNVDRLHTRAGSTHVVELHGNLLEYLCFDNRHPAGEVPLNLKSPPTCAECGSLLRPAVVWFGESLPPAALHEAGAIINGADVALVVGTSGIVQPAASLPFIARKAGATVIEINPERTPISDMAHIFLRGTAAGVLPQLVELCAEFADPSEKG